MTDPAAIDIQGILHRLPHRFPFLLVDRVLEISPGESIQAIKNVSINEAHFVGHFPQLPVMPGVLIIEALAQAGGILAWETANAERQNVTILYLAGIDKSRFKSLVEPGDQLQLYARMVKSRMGIWKYECQASVGDRIAATAEITMVSRREP